MLHRQFPATATQATVSAYYLAGITVGISPFTAAKEWAFATIDALDVPPLEIIEIATANDRESAMAALGQASASADQRQAGRWLLADLHQQLASGSITPIQAARFAMLVVQATALPQDIWHDFDGLDDDLQLAVNGTFSTPEEIGRDVLLALKQHSGAA